MTKFLRLLPLLALSLFTHQALAQTYGSAQGQITSPSQMSLNGVFLSAGLPSAATYLGYTAYTSDLGPVYSNGTTWVSVSSGGGAGSFTTLGATGLLTGSGGFKLTGTNTLTSSGNYSVGTAGQNFLGLNSVVTGNVPNAVTFAPVFLNFTWTNFSKTLAPFAFAGLEVDSRFGGAGDVGGFMGIAGYARQTAMTGDQAAGIFSNFVGGTFAATASDTEGGSAGTANGNGTIYGLNNFCTLGAAATFWRGCVGQEINTNVQAGASVEDKVGLQIIQTSTDAVAGTLENAAIVIGTQGGSAVGWTTGLQFGQYFNTWPMTAGGTMIGCSARLHSGSCGTTTYGIDFSNITFTGNFLKSTGFTVDGSGNTVANSVSTASVTVTGAGAGNVPINQWQWGVPVGIPPSGTFNTAGGNGGNYVIGQAPSSSATLSVSGTSGSVTATFSGATLLGTAADVGRVVTILDTTYKYCTITAQSSTTVATCTVSGGTLSGTGPFANAALWLSGTPTTNTTAFSVPLPRAFPAAYMYFGAGAICSTCVSGGANAAGMFYAVCASTTVCTISGGVAGANTPYVSGQPVTIGSPTPFSSSGPAGVITQTLLGQTLLTLSIPGNSLGPNGSLVLDAFGERNSNTDTVVFIAQYGGTAFAQAASASQFWYPLHRTLRNTGATNSQVFIPTSANAATDQAYNNNALPSYLSIDSTAAQNLLLRGQLTTAATDWFFTTGGTITTNYSP